MFPVPVSSHGRSVGGEEVAGSGVSLANVSALEGARWSPKIREGIAVWGRQRYAVVWQQVQRGQSGEERVASGAGPYAVIQLQVARNGGPVWTDCRQVLGADEHVVFGVVLEEGR